MLHHAHSWVLNRYTGSGTTSHWPTHWLTARSTIVVIGFLPRNPVVGGWPVPPRSTRPDFLAIPVAWRDAQVKAWVDPGIHAGQACVDHLATVVDVLANRQDVCGAARKRKCRIDTAALGLYLPIKQHEKPYAPAVLLRQNLDGSHCQSHAVITARWRQHFGTWRPVSSAARQIWPGLHSPLRPKLYAHIDHCAPPTLIGGRKVRQLYLGGIWCVAFVAGS